MSKFVYTEHLKLRLKLRRIPENYPEEIYKNAEQEFYDELEGYFVSIKKLMYNGKLRNMMIAYEKKVDGIEIVTIHPIKDEKISSRVVNGRWTKI